MKDNYFNYIVFFAFENLIKCENRYEVSIENLLNYRKEIVKRVKKNIDFLTKHRTREVRENLENFISVNESMNREDEEKILNDFINKNGSLFGKNDKNVFLKKKLPYEDVAEIRFRAQEETLRNTILAIFKEAITFESLEALECTSLLEETKKIIDVEKQIEEAYMGDDDDTNFQIINIGNFFVRGKLLSIVKRGYNIIDTHYSNLLEMSSRNNNHDWITDVILSNRIREESTMFLDNIYIDEEFSNLFQKAIFDNEPLTFKALINYFDDIWDYIYKDDIEANEKVESILYDLFGDDDEMDNDEYDDIDDTHVERAKFFFYLTYINKLDELLSNGCEDLSETRNRLLYALNYYDSGLKNKKHLKSVFKNLNDEDYNIIEFQDIYVMARIMLIDILDYGNYDKLLKKVLFISTYYKLTHDNRVRRILKAYQDPTLGIDLTNAIVNDNFNVITSIEKNRSNGKQKKKGE